MPHAVAMFEHGLNPHYFANPPAFTYVLHYLFALAYGGKTGVRHALAFDPTEVYTLARIAAAVLGVAALWLLYAVGARLFGRGVGLLAAAIEAVAFLPVFYAHLALNDVPTLAPLTLSLLGSAGVLRKGRKRDYLLAGVGLGLACASKYTAGIAIVPFVAVVAARYLDGNAHAGRDALVGLAVCAAAALLAFFIANPYSLLDYHSFHRELVHQSTLSAESQGKLGAPRDGGLAYYLWSLTWGLGWLPALAALGGALAIWRRGQRSAGCSFPRRCCSSRSWACRAATSGAGCCRSSRCCACSRRCSCCGARICSAVWRSGRPPLAAAQTLQRTRGVPAQRLGRGWESSSRHCSARPCWRRGWCSACTPGWCSRARTRATSRARGWSPTCPPGAKIVAEPVSPDEWARERKPGTSTAANDYRWHKYPSLLSRISPTGALLHSGYSVVGIENYERTLSPALIGYYERHGYCIVVSGSTQSGRAFADPRGGAAGDRLLPRAAGAGGSRSFAPRPTRAARARSPSASTGALTTTRWPITGRARR